VHNKSYRERQRERERERERERDILIIKGVCFFVAMEVKILKIIMNKLIYSMYSLFMVKKHKKTFVIFLYNNIKYSHLTITQYRESY
jgi:hypothetical protein